MFNALASDGITQVALLTGAETAAFLANISTEFVVSSAVMTRPADTTPYDLGDFIANNPAAGLVTLIPLTIAKVNGGAGRLNNVRLFKSSNNLLNAQFRAHFYSAPFTPTNGDNGAWLTTGYVGGSPIYLGSADIVVNKAFSDGAVGEGYATYGAFIPFKAAAGSQNIYYALEARSKYTPISNETFVLTVEGDAN